MRRPTWALAHAASTSPVACHVSNNKRRCAGVVLRKCTPWPIVSPLTTTRAVLRAAALLPLLSRYHRSQISALCSCPIQDMQKPPFWCDYRRRGVRPEGRGRTALGAGERRWARADAPLARERGGASAGGTAGPSVGSSVGPAPAQGRRWAASGGSCGSARRAGCRHDAARNRAWRGGYRRRSRAGRWPRRAQPHRSAAAISGVPRP